VAVLALILARAGSKGVPGKNRAVVGGRPCIAWTIDAAKSSRLVDHIAVSTDDPAIADIAASMVHAMLPRPAPLASDTARIDDAARDAVLSFERGLVSPPSPRAGEGPARLGDAGGRGAVGLIAILYANVPIRPPGLIDRALQLLAETNADSVQSYQPVGKNHPWWTVVVNPGTGDVMPWEGDVLNHGVFRRQDLPPAHIPDGGVLAVTRRALFLETPNVSPGPHAFFGATRRGILNPEGSVVDIDSPLDLVVADAMVRAQSPSPAC